MPNTKDIDLSKTGKPKFLLVGGPGSGKSAQALTLPGKTFAYLFDPSALSTLRKGEMEYEMFVPEVVSMSVKLLKKGQGDPTKQPKNKDLVKASDVYTLWENDFQNRIDTGYFADVDNILFDSLTTFSDIVMDRILHLNNRDGRWPQQDDWTAQISTIRNVFRTLTGQTHMILVATAHDNFKQDEVTSRMMNQIMVTGQLRVKLPLLFSEILHTECVSTAKEVKYTVQTRPDRMNPSVRCSFDNLEMFEDVTIPDFSRAKNYGIGRLLKNSGFYNS